MIFREGIKIELKKQYVKDINKTVVAFANTEGGKVYIGINDDQSFVGVEDSDAVLLKLTNMLRDTIKPDITTFTRVSIEDINQNEVIILEVQKGTSCPYYLANKGIRSEGVYVRQGASSVPASESGILKMIKETDGEIYEELRSLNQELHFVELEKEFDDSDIVLGESQMKMLHILDKDGLFTNLGLLLSEECEHSIKAAVFEDTSKMHFKDRFEFSGSIMKQMREVFSFLDRYNRTSSELKGLTRVDKREYPVVAIREALLNSIVHKDYAYGGSTLISVFDNRIEFVTLGGLVKGIEKEDIMIGVSLLRNKNLANVFYKLKWIEAYGTGIRKIIESYDEYSEKPMFEITANAFKVTLPIAISFDQVYTREITFNKNEQKIIEMFIKVDEIRRKDVETILGISQPMAVNHLKSLIEKEVIEKYGQGKNTYYTLKE